MSSFAARFVLYIGFILIASLFHSSAFIALIIPLLGKIRITFWRVLVVFGVVSVGFFTGVGNRVVPILSTLSSHYSEKYRNQTTFFTSGDKGIVEFIPVLLQFLFFLLIVLYDSEFVRKNSFLCTAYFTYLALFVLGGNNAAVRVQFYWLFATVFFTAKYIQSGERKIGIFASSLLKIVIILFWLAYGIFRVLRNNSSIVPYMMG